MVIVKNQDCSTDKCELVLCEPPFALNKSQGLFENRIVQLIVIVEEILSSHGVCRLMIHFSNNQLTCWAYGDPNGYKIFTAKEVFQSSFMDQFRVSTFLAPLTEQIIPVKIPMNKSYVILEEFWRMRTTNQTMCLRSAYFNRLNGSISLTFSHNGNNFILYSDSFNTTSQFRLTSQVA